MRRGAEKRLNEPRTALMRESSDTSGWRNACGTNRKQHHASCH